MIRFPIAKYCVLATLMRQTLNGYKILKKLRDIGGISTGTLYPLLQDITKEGLLSARVEGKQTFYTVTKRGKSEFFILDHKMKTMQSYVKETVGFKTTKLIITDNPQ